MFTKTEIIKYFTGEKTESIVFLSIGLVAIFAAFYCWFGIGSSFYKGFALPLFLIGTLMGTVGKTIYNRSDADIERVTNQLTTNPSALKTEELSRMKAVMKSFVVYRYVELFLIVTGLFLFIYFTNNENAIFWKGFGIALTIMAAIALCADYFAEKRGHEYINNLKSFLNQ
jgi:hypothetical protein